MDPHELTREELEKEIAYWEAALKEMEGSGGLSASSLSSFAAKRIDNLKGLLKSKEGT